MRKFYVYFPNSETLSFVLSWSHYFEILKSDDPLEISFYTKECEAQKWSEVYHIIEAHAESENTEQK